MSAGTAIGLQALMGTGMFSTESTLQKHQKFLKHTHNSGYLWIMISWINQLKWNSKSVAEQLKGLTDTGDKAVIHYGSWTDATLVKAVKFT